MVSDPVCGPRRGRGALLAVLVAVCLHAFASAASVERGAALALAEAERLALARDPLIQRFEVQSQALKDQAVADAQWPDPKLRFGIESLPIDNFSRSSEDMTQVQVGVAQELPRGRTLTLKGDQTRALAAAEDQRAADQARGVLRAVRASFLEAYYQARAQEVMRRSRGLLAQVVDVTKAQYAAGRDVQQDIWRVQLEVSRIDDRLTRAALDEDVARAELGKWIGSSEAQRPFPDRLPVLPELADKAAILAQLPQHPLMRAEDAQVEASRRDVDLAKEAYKPGWMLELTYGQRVGSTPEGDPRSDMVSAMATVDLPVFRDKRQDRRLAASQKQARAAEFARADRLRELTAQLDAEYGNWTRLGERLALYRARLIPQSAENARAALRAYQSGVQDFTPVLSAYQGELENRLEALRVEVDRAKAQANLMYLVEAPGAAP